MVIVEVAKVFVVPLQVIVHEHHWLVGVDVR